jgi:hypothetical protein
MRVLWIQPLSYYRALTGASRANRVVIDNLTRSGLVCDVLALDDKFGGWGTAGPVERALPDSSAVKVFPGLGELIEQLPALLDVTYDWIVVSEDSTASLLSTVIRHGRRAGGHTPICYFGHGPSALPFGPYSFLRDESSRDLFNSVDLFVTVSEWMRTYIRKNSGIDAVRIDLPVYGDGPFQELGSPDSGRVTMINASLVKGLWATTSTDRNRLAELRNVEILPPVGNIEEIYQQCRVLLVPSLSPEGLGLVAVEAMLRGIPVVASDQGGLVEAKLGVDYVLQVAGIDGYDRHQLDELRNPKPIFREIAYLDDWEKALRGLVTDRATYERVSAESRQAAERYVSGLRSDQLARLLGGGDKIEASSGANGAR